MKTLPNKALIRVMRLSIVSFLVGLMLAGCTAMNSVSTAIQAYQIKAEEIELGQTKSQVLAILQPTQANLPQQFAKPAEEYFEDGKHKEIHFFRSRSFPDGLVTDDEFTPYVFENEKLVAIGWTAIGGPKTQAQTKDNELDYHFHGRVFRY